MDRLKILCCGYREWALWLFSHLDYEKVIIKSPEKLKEVYREFNPDVVLLIGWSWIVPRDIYKNTPTLCLHPSPLPKYRGGSPIQHQIINGEEKSAVTLFMVDDGIDTGDILGQTEISLNYDLDNIFGEIVAKGLLLIKNTLLDYPNFKRTPQTGVATVYERRTPEESELKVIDFATKTAKELYDFVRALDDPYPNAFITCVDGERLYFKEVSLGT